MPWRLAISLETLRAEVNEMAPNRSKRSDGTLGDPDHADRDSRHNPNQFDVVTALDLTHDPAAGCDIHGLARGVARDPHPELAYIISDGEVAKRRNGFRWERYYGDNQHRLHAHFAVGIGPDSDPMPPYDSMVSWFQQEADNVTPEDILKIAEAVTIAQQPQIDSLRKRLDEVQKNLAAVPRRILGVEEMADSSEQHKADRLVGEQFKKLLGDG